MNSSVNALIYLRFNARFRRQFVAILRGRGICERPVRIRLPFHLPTTVYLDECSVMVSLGGGGQECELTYPPALPKYDRRTTVAQSKAYTSRYQALA